MRVILRAIDCVRRDCAETGGRTDLRHPSEVLMG